MDRFWSKVEKTDTCWNWTASLMGSGYGNFSFEGKLVGAHRFSWILAHGKIPDGLHIDHLCKNRKCVNPDHLEPVTIGENNLRSKGTHCKHGHEYNEENTLTRKNGSRQCRVCARRIDSKRKKKSKFREILNRNKK